MEAGENDVKRESKKHFFAGHCDIDINSEVFDVVVDPLTDFKVHDLKCETSSPQQSFNLPSSLSSFHSTSEGTLQNLSSKSSSSLTSSSSFLPEETKESASFPPSPAHPAYTNLWSSDVSLSSGSGTDCVTDRAGSSGIGGGSNHRRLVVPEVHRFGCHPPCAGSPHDLASCPIASVSATQKGYQAERLSVGKRGETDERYDALKALSQASSALALTETIIGPLRIPPVSQEVLNEVVSNMERKASFSIFNNGNASGPHQKSNFQTPSMIDSSRSVESCPTPAINLSRSSITAVTSSIGNTNYVSRGLLDSSPTIVEPDIHKISKNTANVLAESQKPFSHSHNDYGWERDTKINNSDLGIRNGGTVSSTDVLSDTRVIAVPVVLRDHGPVEVYKAVHPYPASSITTTVERCSYIGQTQVGTHPPSGKSKRKKPAQKLKNKKSNELHHSQLSVASGSSACPSIASDCTLVSKNSSELTPTTHSHGSSSKSLNDSRSDCGGPISKPILSAAIMQMRQALESVSNVSDNPSDKFSGEVDVASNFSDTSSNLSTLSDLSGYEDEYIRIKRLVSDAVIPPEDYKKLLHKTNTKSNVSKSVPTVDYEKIIRDLHAQKEDLEIQLHRLSIQVQNAVREKELYQQQLELMNTKITETNQKQYFEVLKQRANLEGQLEMLKQELENSVYEKSQLQSKVSESVKEAELSKSVAAEAKEAECHMSERLLKYEEANKDLEEKLKISSEELAKFNIEYGKTKDELAIVSDKNINLELSQEQLQETESRLMAEIKGLRSHMSQLQSECQAKAQAQHHAEASANKASSELKASQTSSLWYQEQLQLSQAARSSIQQELLEARASIARLSSEKESLDMKVQTLVREAEDGQARAVREKASLVAHLEALQADMAERESVVSQMERDRGNDTKLMEDRRQRLEQDRHRIHKLRLDLSDTERHLDTLKDDLKHKCALVSKYEKELKGLRTLEAVNQEVLGEKDARIQNLEQSLSETKLLIKNEQQELREKLLMVSTLKEENSKLEVALTVANNEKRDVDDAIIKVREDMTKLSSNFYRMKHDIAAKDRQIEVYKREVEEIQYSKDSWEKKCQVLEVKMKDDDTKKKYLLEIESLKKEIKELTKEKENLNGILTEIKRTLKTLEIEKKGLSEAVRLREEQIQNMQESLENYREAILKKDEELYVAHEQNSSVEKSYAELRQNWEVLKEDNMALRQEAEAYTEHERTQVRELFDLKESIQKERKLKQNLEKKMEKVVKVQQEDQQKVESEKTEREKLLRDLSQELQVLKEEKIQYSETCVKLEKNYADVCQELEILKEEKTKLERKLKDAHTELNASKQDNLSNIETMKLLESKMELLLKENSDITNRLTALQSEKNIQITELQDLLQMKGEEILKGKKILEERESVVSKLKELTEQTSNQVSNLMAENAHLKKKLVSNEVLVKESRSSDEHKEVGNKKQVKSLNSLQKEISEMQIKYNETDTKLKEMTKQKENLQIAVKNTKKESLLMKAKMKEFTSLKAKCKELELSKVSNNDLSSLESKCSELESRLKSEEGKLSSLEACLSDKENVIQALKQREGELGSQIATLHEEKRDLQHKITLLEDICHKSQADIAQYQVQLKTVENERDECMVKYESLRDFIPERDTSTQRAVQLVMSESQVLRNSQETLAVASLEHASTLNVTHPDIGFLSDMSQTTISSDSQFDKTMAGLQAQVTLTSKALQSKENQICDLQHQISLLRVGDSSASNVNVIPQDVLNSAGEAIPVQVHKQQIQNLLEKIKQLQIPKDSSTTEENETLPSKEVSVDEIQIMLSKIKNLESSVSSKEDELEKAQTKITEFQEKHRRYESNVRLLTRKLKEHMKGRKSAEKEMQIQAEDHQRLMNEEHQRYSVLRCRCIELEGRCESLEGQVVSLETEVEEVRSALNSARQEAQNHHQNTLSLQKEIGRLQELAKAADNLRSEIARLEEKLNKKEARVKELEQELLTVCEQQKENQAATETLKCSLQQQQDETKHLQQQYADTEAKLVDIRQQLKSKEEAYSKVQQTLKDVESNKSELRQQLLEKEENSRQMSAEIQRLKEEHLKATDEGQHTKMQLQDSIARNNALENHIKVVEGELKVAKEEVSVGKERQINRDATHQVSLGQLEESVNRSRQEVVALTTQLSQVQRERVSYQTQATELRMALHSALAQLKTLEIAEEAREEEASSIQSEVGIIPSPTPLDLTALTELMERSVRPIRPDAPLNSLQSCLSSLKAEVATLQNQLQTKGKELSDESNIEVDGDVMATENTSALSKTTSGTEIV